MAIYLDDKVMNGKKEVCKYLEIEPNSIPAVRRKVMELHTKQIDDKGTKRSPKSLGGKPEYIIFVPHLQREVKVRYATTQRKDKEGSPTYPFPKSLFLQPAEDGSVLINDELEFLFWFLHPMCLQSPFHKKDSMSFYEFQDKDAQARVDIAREEAIIDAMSIVVGANSWSDLQLKHLAKGLNISGVDDMTPAVVKQHLKHLAHKDPGGFYNKATSREVLFSGKIQEAIDQNILRLESKNGMQRWYLLKEEILPIQYGQDPITELKNHMAEKWYLYSDSITAAIDGVTVNSLLNNPQNDQVFSNNEAQVQKLVVKAELTPEQQEMLKAMRLTDWQEAKIAKLAAYDINDPKLHVASRKSYEANIDLINAYLAEQNSKEEITE